MQQNPKQKQNPKQTIFSIHFGQPIPQQKITPLDISLKVFLNENNQKLQNVKFNFQQYLKVEIPMNSIVLEIPVANGDAQTLANKLKPENSELIKNIVQTGNLSIFKAIPDIKSNKVCIIIHGQQLSYNLQMLSHFAQPFEKQTKQSNQQKFEQALEFQIQSTNSIQEILNLTNQKHAIRAILDSLQVKVAFNKSKSVVRFLSSLFQTFGPSQISPVFQGITKSYERTSLRIKCSSSRYLEQYASWNEFLKPSKLGLADNYIKQLDKLLKDTGDDIKIYVFGSEVGISGKIHIEGSKSILSMFDS